MVELEFLLDVIVIEMPRRPLLLDILIFKFLAKFGYLTHFDTREISQENYSVCKKGRLWPAHSILQ